MSIRPAAALTLAHSSSYFIPKGIAYDPLDRSNIEQAVPNGFLYRQRMFPLWLVILGLTLSTCGF